MGEKEIVTIDDIKYEKVQYTYTPTLEHRFMGLYPIFSENYALEFQSTPEAREKMHEHKDFAHVENPLLCNFRRAWIFMFT